MSQHSRPVAAPHPYILPSAVCKLHATPHAGGAVLGTIPGAVELFNSLGRERQTLTPREGRRVGFYLCGPTVQSGPHVGHGRSAVAFDVIRRYLEWAGYDVEFVMNITDVEDRIISAANERGLSAAAVAAEAADEFLKAYRALGVHDPDVMPKATDHIDLMIGHIQSLIDGGLAYAADGDVYFAVRSHPEYGKLSGRDLDEMQAGARVEPGAHKRDPLDFALWKAAKPDEPSWESPWGPGRPGWHIECSVMAEKYLGYGFDIHAGGADLMFPHHENEIAQSEALHGSGEFARVWLHNGLVNLAEEKMSKSTGVLVDLNDAITQFGAPALRLFYLRKRYRDPLEFSDAAMADTPGQLDRLWSFRRRVADATDSPHEPSLARFRQAMDDDANTAEALAVLFDLVRAGNRTLDSGEDAGPYAAAYDAIVGVLGLAEPEQHAAATPELEELAAVHGVTGNDPAELVDLLVTRREEARTSGDWGMADDIRDRLAGAGYAVEDTPDGPRWHRK